jgi:hypothetical protein
MTVGSADGLAIGAGGLPSKADNGDFAARDGSDPGLEAFGALEGLLAAFAAGDLLVFAVLVLISTSFLNYCYWG